MKFSDKGILFSPVRGRHYLKARGNTTVKEIFYNATDPAPVLPFIILVPGFEHILRFSLTWKALMTEQKAIARGLRPIATFEKNVNEKNESKDEILPQKMCVVERTEENQYYLLDREIHPFILEMTSEDGGAFQFIFVFTVQINDMIQVMADYPLGNFLETAEKKLISEISCIFRPMKFPELKRIRNDKIQERKESIVNALNKDFQPHGFELLEVMLEKVVILPNSQDRIDSEEKVGIAENENKVIVLNAEAKAKSIKITRAAEIGMRTKETTDVGMAEADVLDKKLRNLYDFRVADKAQINLTQKVVSQNLGQTKGVIVLGNGSGLESDDKLISNIIANAIQTNKEGGDHA